ncbi:MAG: hypothetical protein H0X34_07070 [Chthoniobacterales bacterium]|nr:hypothetical protein [Chthoniobacterales bacterium]
MRHIRLIAAADEYDTAPGLIIKGQPDFESLMADRDGTLIAHDILEHQNGTEPMGAVWDELEALGAIWQVRGRHGDMASRRPSFHSAQSNVASEVTRMFSEYETDPNNGPGGLLVGSRPHLYDEDFAEIIEIARRDIPREYNNMGNGSEGEDANGWSPELHEIFETYLTLALHRMRAGFRKAEKRFGDGFAGHSLFVAIRDAVGDAVKSVDYEGQEFRLSYGNGEATCTEVVESEA